MTTIEKVGSEFVVNTNPASIFYTPKISALADGGFAITWIDNQVGQLQQEVQLFDSDGTKVGGESETLGYNFPYDYQEPGALARLTDGDSVVCYTDYNASALGDSSSGSVVAQLLDQNGANIGATFLVNTQTDGFQGDPSVTGLADGGFAVAWSSMGTGIWSVNAQVFDASGAKVGTEFVVDTGVSNTGGEMFPQIAGLADGDFVVTWQTFGGLPGDSSGESIAAQIFDANGAKVGAEFQVNTETLYSQYDPQVAALANGDFVISWTDESGTLGDTSGTSVKAQVFDENGVKVGPEFLVNTETTKNQDAQTVVGLPDGQFVIAWRDSSQAPGDTNSGSSIKAQIFEVASEDAPVISTLVGQPVAGQAIEVKGTGEVGSTVTLYADGGSTSVGSGTVAADGSFDITTSTTFADGSHMLTATQTDATALTSVASAGFAVGVDPVAPVISTVDAPIYTYTTLTNGTAAYGINDEGQIVGTYGNNGFLYISGIYTTIHDPSASGPYGSGTAAYGINNYGEVVGTYSQDYSTHGFLYSKGSYVTLDDPNGIGSTAAFGINDNGQVVGDYQDSNGLYHGFFYNGVSYTTLDDPSATQGTYAFGINDAGQIVGIYNGVDGQHGFLYSNGSYTNIDDPLGGTRAYGINNSGQIVGQYSDNSGGHGFLYCGGAYTTTNDPTTPNGTVDFGLNDHGQIVGTAISNGTTNGFLASPTAEVKGTGAAGDTITLYADGGTTPVGTGTVAADGSFDVTTTTTFADGDHTLTATQTDTAGLTSPPTEYECVICFMPGTLVRTPFGEVAVETLNRGDLVITADSRTVMVDWLGVQTVSLKFADKLRVLPIRIKAGALAENVPSRDLLVSPDHAILVEGALIQAGALVNGTSVVRETNVPTTFTYYHVEVQDHSLILAENAPAETFVDNIDRLHFDNWAEHEALYPDGKPIDELPYPRAKSHRQVSMRTRMMLAARSQAILGEKEEVA
jgi:probable HAF family extracellular repeat protein